MAEFDYKEKYLTEDLIRIMALLRSENGCPWDREQTHDSIRQNFIEEVYEACEAIDDKNSELLCEELGDVLLQVVFHARISEEEGGFSFDDVTDGVCKKLIVRHPHIFGGKELKTGKAAEVLANWETIKNATKHSTTAAQTLKDVAKSLPALVRAEKVQSRAERGKPGSTGEKGAAELLRLASEAGQEMSQDKLGELLFAAVKLARENGVNPEGALEAYTNGFIENFVRDEERQ